MIKKCLKVLWRFPYRLINKIRLKNKNFSILSCNCIAGGWYHDAFQQFKTPTINLTVYNFLSFVERIDYYLSQDMLDNGVDAKSVPLGVIEDVIIRGVHFASFSELKNSWDKRKQRINKDNIFIVATDEFVKTEEDKERFNKLPYPKVCFISKKIDVVFDWQIYLPGFEHLSYVGDSMVYCDIFGRRINEKYFDYIYWLNNKTIKKKKLR